jgi:transposase
VNGHIYVIGSGNHNPYGHYPFLDNANNIDEEFTPVVDEVKSNGTSQSIKRSLTSARPKNDKADSRAIAAYLARFWDRLTLWQPIHPALDRIQTLLRFREHLVKTCTSHQNFRRSQAKAQHVNAFSMNFLGEQITMLKQQIKECTKEIRRIIAGHQAWEECYRSMVSLPGIDTLAAANFLVATKGDPAMMTYKRMANYLGICPHERSSGTSVRKKPRSSRRGNTRIRKLLHLAARSVAVHNHTFKQYYCKKLRDGKAKLLIYNNIANRLLRMLCALVRKKTLFQKNYLPPTPMIKRS